MEGFHREHVNIRSLLQPIKKEHDFFTKSQLKERGWTEKSISALLGDPDRLRVNSFHRSGPRIQLFDAKRVFLAEKSEEFIAARKQKRKRALAAEAGVATKTEKIKSYVEGLKIEVPIWPKDKLIAAACDSWNAHNDAKLYPSPDNASVKSDVDFLDRICVNFLRHEMTIYDEKLSEIFGKVGKEQAYSILKRKVLTAISDAYPWLSDECSNQQPGGE